MLRNGRPISTRATEALSNEHVVSILPSLEPLSTASSSAPGEPVGELASFIGLEIGRPAAFCVSVCPVNILLHMKITQAGGEIIEVVNIYVNIKTAVIMYYVLVNC